MNAAIVIVVVGACLLLVGRTILAKLGIGKPGGKPDCGCGHCASKKGRKQL